ncbi:MAG: flagellar protein FlgN [Thermodesulfobacteriota bacterium]
MAKKLINILNQEMPLYKELLSLLQEEKRLLSTRTRDELYQLSARIEALVFKVKGMERAREAAVTELALSLGLEETEARRVNLTKLLNSLKEPYRGELQRLQSLFLALVGSIEELNRENSVIIGRSIDNIKSTFDFIRELSSLQLYKPNGIVDNPPINR